MNKRYTISMLYFPYTLCFLKLLLKYSLLTSSHRIPYNHATFCWNGGSESVWTHIPIFVLAGSLVNKSPVACYWAGWCKCFSESMGPRFGSPGQKALTAMNEFTLFWIFASSIYPRPVPLMYQPRICKDGFISIVFDLSQVCRLFDRALVDTRPLLRSLPTV